MSDLTEADIKKLKVVELKSELTSRGLATNGNKAALVARLIEFVEESQNEGDEGGEDTEPDAAEETPAVEEETPVAAEPVAEETTEPVTEEATAEPAVEPMEEKETVEEPVALEMETSETPTVADVEEAKEEETMDASTPVEEEKTEPATTESVEPAPVEEPTAVEEKSEAMETEASSDKKDEPQTTADESKDHGVSMMLLLHWQYLDHGLSMEREILKMKMQISSFTTFHLTPPFVFRNWSATTESVEPAPVEEPTAAEEKSEAMETEASSDKKDEPQTTADESKGKLIHPLNHHLPIVTLSPFPIMKFGNYKKFGNYEKRFSKKTIQILSELFPDHKFKCEARQSDVRATLILNGERFIGIGCSDKIAKLNATQQAFGQHNIPFANLNHLDVSRKSAKEMKHVSKVEAVTDEVSCVKKLFGPEAVFDGPLEINVVGLAYFKMRLHVQGRTFESMASSKRKAEKKVAKSCLSFFFKLSAHPSYVIENRFGSTVKDMFIKVTGNINKIFVPVRNIVALALVTGSDFRLISLASGDAYQTNVHDTTTKRFTNDERLKECSAEALAIRAFRRFLADELIDPQKSGLFDKLKDGKWQIKSVFDVVMITNAPPLGSASISESRKKNCVASDQSHPDRIQYPVQVERYGNIIRLTTSTSSEKTNLVSPSDLLMMYNIVGIQGAHLSNVLQPVYVNRYLHTNCRSFMRSIERSIFTRAENFNLARLNRPEFAQFTTRLPTSKKLSKYAGWWSCLSLPDTVNWEVLDGFEGLCFTPPADSSDFVGTEVPLARRREALQELKASYRPSKLCRAEMLELYKTVVGAEPDTEYLSQVDLARKKCSSAGLGDWS
eukprot:sb/3462062/